MPAKWAALLVAFFMAQPAWAALATTWEQDFDTKEWQEIEAQLPRTPQDKDLVLLDLGAAAAHRFYVDPPSVTVGPDGVVRYTAVIKTAGGARNVMFEGLRCETRELKIYALGRVDGSWVRARAAGWKRITRDQPYHYTLYREYFCPSHSRPTPPQQAIEAMRRGQGLNTSFTID